MNLLAAAPVGLALANALEHVAARAGGLDRAPRFPQENLRDLRESGALGPQAPATATLTAQIALVRAVARVDASTARVLDGHLNGVERLLTLSPPELGPEELSNVASGRLWVGVWGADPRGGEGEPAQLARDGRGALVLRGVKVFCSGAGGVQRALVVARDGDGARRLVYVDTSSGLEVDRGWYRASGLRSSESHRVVFADTPVLALLGGPDELLRMPYFARDGVRTIATWAGLCDAIAQVTIAAVVGAKTDAHQDGALGRMHVHEGTIDLWLAHAARTLDNPDTSAERCRELAIATRAAVADASRAVATLSAQVCGSRALATLEELDRPRRDLEIFLLQHRVEPQLETLGRALRSAEA